MSLPITALHLEPSHVTSDQKKAISATRKEVSFQIYEKENILSCSEERGIHYKFTICYYDSHAYPHRLLQTANLTMKKRDIKAFFFS